MDILDLINEELKGKNWSLEEKAYYIYIRSCELFSYDPRFAFCERLPEYNSLKEKIMNRKIDLHNVQDNRVICTSHSKEVICQLMGQLLNIDVWYQGTSHAWVMFNFGDDIYMRADTTASLDITRIKMGLSTYGYKPMTKCCNFQKDLKRIAQQIGYIQDEYQEEMLKRRHEDLYKEFSLYSFPEIYTKDSDDYLIYRTNVIKEIFESFHKLQNFSDAQFCISYLMKTFSYQQFNEVDPISLFEEKSQEEWDFVDIYQIPLSNDMMYFMLGKEDNEFSFHEITLGDVKHYVKQWDGINKKIIMR